MTLPFLNEFHLTALSVNRNRNEIKLKRIFWIDLEMTGLDVEKEVILEVAAIITDLDFHELDHYSAIVKQPQHYLDNMDAWNKTHHGESGLLSLIPNGEPLEKVESDLLKLADTYFPSKEPVVLAGNSIATDRAFINRYLKEFSYRLHYRMIDVSSWKVIFLEKYGKKFKKTNQHRAVNDIKESLRELKYYLSYINPSAPVK